MTDPRPLTRDDLAKFLPNPRAIRAFEELFKLVPSEFESILILSEGALLAAQAARSEVLQLRQELSALKIELQLLPSSPNLSNIEQRLVKLESEIISRQPINLDPILQRLNFLESSEL